MKTSVLFKSLIALLIIILTNTAFSQKVYDNYLDGHIWFKIKHTEEQFMMRTASRDKNFKDAYSDENIKLSTFPKLRSVFAGHTVTRLSRPFPLAHSSPELLNTYLIEFNDIENVEAFINELEASGVVDYAEKVPLGVVLRRQ